MIRYTVCGTLNPGPASRSPAAPHSNYALTVTFIELSGLVRRIKNQNAKRLIKSGCYAQIDKRTWKRIEPKRHCPEVVEIYGFDYDYPEIPPHPEMQFIPALRYPVDIARQGLTSFEY